MADLVVAFGVIFLVIFALEFTDRTTFALIPLAARSRPIALWAGATLGFAAEVVIAVALGAVLGAALSGDIVYLRIGSGIAILAYAAYLALRTERVRTVRAGATAFSTGFLLIFLLELGDTTWILGLNFALTNPAYIVASAEILALSAVAAIACFLGSRILTKIRPRTLEVATIVILIVVGVVTILTGIYAGLVPTLPGLAGS